MPRKEKKFHFIYKTTNLLSGKYYIGMHSTDNLDDGYLGSGKRLRYSINKYGEENHSREILEFLDSRKELKEREAEIVNLNEIAKIECMNLKVGGEGGNTGPNGEVIGGDRFKGAHKYWEDPENKKRLSKITSDNLKKQWEDPKFRETRLKNIDWTGRKHSEESKKKMSDSSNNKGDNNSQYGTCWIYSDNESIKIKKEDLNSYLKLGWKKGRKLKY